MGRNYARHLHKRRKLEASRFKSDDTRRDNLPATVDKARTFLIDNSFIRSDGNEALLGNIAVQRVNRKNHNVDFISIDVIC